MDMLNIMLCRRSIRKYTSEEISEEKLDAILQAALLAPTSRNRRPCEFFLVKDRDTLAALSTAKKTGAGMLKNAAAAVVVFADPDKADTWIEDSSIALTYMDLMAASLGIGSCWVQIHMRQDANSKDAEENVRMIISVPEHYRTVGMLSLGMPAEHPQPHTTEELSFERVHK